MRILAFFALLLITMQPALAAKKPKMKATSLQVLESYTIPAVELSGMAWRTNPTSKAKELVMISDREREVYLFNWSERKTKVSVQTISVPGGKALDGQSDWESVSADESGRIFAIRENPPQITVISPDLKKVEAVIDLKIDWEEGMNSGAEGVLLLKNGHVLVAKEKDPLEVIEFAPKGQAPTGYREDLSLEKNGSFPFTAGVTLIPVFTWTFEKKDGKRFRDVSGVNVDHLGNLFLLGEERGIIGKIGKELSPKTDVLKIAELYDLPEEIRGAEGMVIDAENHPIIVIDSKKTNAPNLFFLSPLVSPKKD